MRLRIHDDPDQAPENDRHGSIQHWSLRVALVGAAVLVLARFIKYVQVVDEISVEFADALTWWAVYVVGTALTLYGAVDAWDEDATLAGWAALLVGLLILVLMPSAPLGFPTNVPF